MSRETISVLLVASRSENTENLIRWLKELAIELTEVEDCRQAREQLAEERPPSVVISATSLPDGNWCDVLGAVVKAGAQSAFIIHCVAADERLWSEALWRGTYDLLVEPLEADHVKRCIEGAHRSRSDRSFYRTAST